MPVTTKERLALVALAIAVLGVLIWFIWPSGRTRTELLQEAGYLEMVPPSKFHGPGTINTIELRSDGKVQLHPTCNIEDDRLAQYLIESPTEDHALVQYLNKGFDISAQIEGILSVNVDRNKTKKLFVSFQNVSILLMTDESLLLLQNEILRNTCQEAVVVNLENNGIVCQTAAVIKADAIYKITFEDGVSVSEQERLASAVASEFHIEASQASTDQITGKGLFYGVKLAPRGLLLNRPDATKVDCGDLFD